MAARKRAVRLHAFVAEMKSKPEVWASAQEGARQVNESVVALCRIAGKSVTADFLRQWAEVLSERDRRANARKRSLIPSITGRRSNDPEGDAALKAKLRNPPTGAKGKPQTIAEMARLRAFGRDRRPASEADEAAYGSARRHLARLKAEIRVEEAQATADFLTGLGLEDPPNLLAAFAGRLPPKGET